MAFYWGWEREDAWTGGAIGEGVVVEVMVGGVVAAAVGRGEGGFADGLVLVDGSVCLVSTTFLVL